MQLDFEKVLLPAGITSMYEMKLLFSPHRRGSRALKSSAESVVLALTKQSEERTTPNDRGRVVNVSDMSTILRMH